MSTAPGARATLREALDAAVAHHRAGRLDAADALYGRILDADPDNADALNLRGALAAQRGDPTTALALLQRAVAQRPEVAEFHSNLAAVWMQLGRFDEARACSDAALQLDPDCLDAQLNQAKALVALGELAAADAAYARSIAMDPTHAAAQHARGRLHEREGRYAEALECFEAASGSSPAPLVLVDLGSAFGRFGRLETAQECYRRALAARPDLALAHYGLGITLASQGRHAEALTRYEQAVACRPNDPRFQSARADALKDTGRLDEAIAGYERALALDPENFEARNHLGTVYENQGRLAEAAACYDALLARHESPAVRFKRATLLPVIYTSGEDLLDHRRRLTEGLDRLVAEGLRLDPVRDMLPPSFYLAYQGQNDIDVHRSIASLCAESSRDFTARRQARPRQDRRLRIGFVSSFFRHHTIGKLTRGLVAELARERFQVTVCSLGAAEDGMAQWIGEHADRTVALPIRPAPARRRLAEEAFDVLFYPDIGMSPAAFALAVSRLAPVQCVSWGHPVTTGLPSIDYFLSSRLLEPEDAREHYSEELVLLESLPTYYYRPTAPTPDAGSPRERHGLAPDDHVYLCPQSLFKLHPDFDRALGAILAGDPRGRVVLVEGLYAHWGDELRGRFRRRFGALADRIQFLPRMAEADFLGLLASADVMLDPWHFGGGNSSYEALALGTPIVTLPGAFLRGRVTLGCYRKIGILDGVARDADDYVERALRLGTDPDERSALAERLRAANGPLFEDAGAVREIEAFLCEAFSRVR